MDEKQALMDLYKSQLDRWNRRRTDEWAITITLWTGIMVATGYLAGNLEIPREPLLIVYVVVLVLYGVFWALFITYANDVDKLWADVYRSRINNLLGIIDGFNEEKTMDILRANTGFTKCSFIRRRKLLLDWSFLAKVIFTAVILSFSWYILSDVNKKWLKEDKVASFEQMKIRLPITLRVEDTQLLIESIKEENSK